MHKLINDDITNICSTGYKPKSWKLNYPALASLMNGGYYVDYASIMVMMGLPAMHHTTWDLGWYPRGAVGRITVTPTLLCTV